MRCYHSNLKQADVINLFMCDLLDFLFSAFVITL